MQIIMQIRSILHHHEGLEVRFQWLLDLSQKRKERERMLQSLRDEEYLGEKRLNSFPLKELLVFGRHMDHLWFPKFKSLWASQTIQLHPREKHTNTHKNPDPLPHLKGVHAPLQAGSIHPACICLIRAISMGEMRRGNLSNPAVRTHRHMEGDGYRAHTGHGTSVVLLNQDLLPQL